jgi:hypothetical protein
MEALLYFAVWAGLFFLTMRYGCGSHVMGHGRKPPFSPRQCALHGGLERKDLHILNSQRVRLEPIKSGGR